MREIKADFVGKENMSIFTDYYELTMCASYFENKRNEPATFDLFIRKLPRNRSYFVFAGLEQVLFFLKNIKFNEAQIEYLRKQGLKDDFLDYLRGFRFTGEVWAVPEGTIVFPDEPLIRVTAPIIEAQLIETFILNTVNIQTMIATKASRVVHAAQGKPVIEFGLRRTQGTDAGMKAARCSYIAGCNGTSNVLAGMTYGIPIFGTMAHSYVMFFDREVDAFRAFAKTFPNSSTFLIDTYDDLKGAENAAIVAKELEKDGYRLRGVRMDSGDLLTLSRRVREILDKHGLHYVKIFASGDLDEYKVDELIRGGAAIDAFGVGTRMSTSYDRPYVDVVYKLSGKVEGGVFVPAMKLSKGKVTLPGKKQIFRQRDQRGMYARDIIGLEDEKINGEPLLVKVMENGEIVAKLPSLEEIRNYALKCLSELPEKYKRLRNAAKYPVRLSPRLREIKRKLAEQLKNVNKNLEE
ncbi:MAG: nicotinate phosphoribosyltransferase [Candidatus Bathyarchaeia archaeon]